MRRYLYLDEEKHPDILCFLDLLSEVFGTRRDAAAAFLRSSPDFREWRKRVAYCRFCNRYVPIKRHIGSNGQYKGYDYHRAPNPDKPPPHSVQCPGSHRRIEQGPGHQARGGQLLNQDLARIKHRVKQVQADLL